MDEARFGLISDLGRRITLRGIKPVASISYRRENFWRYGATDVLSGAGHLRSFMRFNGDNFQQFMTDIASAYPQDIHLMLVDNSRTHLARKLEVPETMALHFLPTYSPNLQPQERLWQQLKQGLKGLLPDALYELQEHIGARLGD